MTAKAETAEDRPRFDPQTGQEIDDISFIRMRLKLPEAYEVMRVFRRGDHPDLTTYEFLLADETLLVLGNARQLFDVRHVRAQIAHSTKRLAPPLNMTQAVWAPIVEAILAAAEDVDGPLREEEELRRDLGSFMESRTGDGSKLNGTDPYTRLQVDPRHAEEVINRIRSDGVWIETDRIVFIPARLVEYVTTYRRVSSQQVYRAASRLGFARPHESRGRIYVQAGEESERQYVLIGQPGWRP